MFFKAYNDIGDIDFQIGNRELQFEHVIQLKDGNLIENCPALIFTQMKCLAHCSHMYM